MSLRSFLFGKKSSTEQLPLLSGQQQGFQNQALQNLMGMLQPGGGLDFAPIEQKARGDFMSKTVPGIAEMFAGMGEGGQRSSAFQGALGQAGAGLEQGLAAMRPQHQMQLMQTLMGPAMQGGFENIYHPQTQGFVGQMAGPIAQMGMGMGKNWMGQHGVYGRGVMDALRGKQQEGQPGFGMDSLTQLLPLLMML